jgi:hypothetical protein
MPFAHSSCRQERIHLARLIGVRVLLPRDALKELRTR